MKVRLQGEETVIDAARSQIPEDGAVVAVDNDAEDVEIVASTETATLRAGNRDAIDAGRSAVLVELGGIGGQAIEGVDGAIVRISPGGPCYRCLELRVGSADDTAPVNRSTPAPGMRRIMGAVAGHWATTDWVPSDDVTVLEFPWTERSLQPVPGCPACANGQRWTPASTARGGSRSLEEAVAAAERAIDERVGLIQSIGEAHSRPLPYYLATLADTGGFSDVVAPRQAAGVAEDWNRALMKAVGEALERYAAGVYREDQFRTASVEAMTDAIPPREFVRPADADPVEGAIPWLPATSLRDGEHRWVPAELAVFPPPTRSIRPAITTGLALGNSRDEARAAGLAEVIERDATMLAWYSTFEPMGVRVDDERFERLVRLAAIEDLTVSTALLTQDVDIPVIAAAVHREGPFPQFAMGSAAGLDPVETAIDALREAIQNWMELDSMGEEGSRSEAPRITRYAVDPGAAGAFMDPDATLDAESLGPSVDDSLVALVDRVTTVAWEPLAVTTTTRDLAGLGFHATRVIVPEAQPLFTGAAYFGDRARRVPREQGFEPRLDRDPHPFP